MNDKNKSVSEELQLVVFRLADEEFALDISQVREIIRMQEITPMPKAPDFITGVLNLRGQIVAVMDLAQRFAIKNSLRTDIARIIIVEVGDSKIGLIVDEVPEVIRMSLNDMEPTPAMIESKVHAEFIKGVGKFQDRLIIVLDAGSILSKEESAHLPVQTEQ
ncbi:MAG TPA: chemotaxis protein CheW [bacterium]|nr:MAG: Chemotaxis protein CheW [bacterium ADurb.Bin270]HPW45705.1 chemotaxis protein CheW [bacterium]HQH80423.1 chemotaxis protein CheW [bacterium]